MNEVLHTKFGNAKINCRGYLAITSRKEGNNAKKLHRLMWEDFYGEIPEGYVIHHKNGNKLDNCILNLQLMRYEDHASMHHKNKVVSEETRRKMSEIASRRMSGKNNPMYGNRHSEESRKKMSESQKGRTPWNKGKKLENLSDSTKLKMSKSKNSTGYFRVVKRKRNDIKGQDFIWAYQYYEDRKPKVITSKDLVKVEQKVIDKGLPWIILDEEKARVSMEENQ